MVHTNAQLKDLYDSRPELKELLLQRAKLFEEEQKRLEDQKADAFVAVIVGSLTNVAAAWANILLQNHRRAQKRPKQRPP